MIASKLPRLQEQQELYAEAMAIAGERPVVFRLLDIGGDKVLPYQRSMAEENPAMGFRSIRLGLERPGLLRTQIRALLLAAHGRPLKILVPMVTETFEFLQTRMVVQKEVERLRRAGKAIPSRLELGVMVEVPSLLFELDQLLPEADFVSIGSNDLVQFLTASDRANPRVAKNYDPIGMPRLRAIRLVVDAARRYNIPITMCGELAGKPLEALALMAIGMTRLSMGPASIGPIKELILNLDLKPIQLSVGAALSDGADGITIRKLLQEWIEKQNLPV
jgi:phosphotransferase system enzyme I (PtsP)